MLALKSRCNSAKTSRIIYKHMYSKDSSNRHELLPKSQRGFMSSDMISC
jgi:hypothetical protein